MFNNGWFRLWVVAVLASAFLAIAIAYSTIWSKDVCYRYVSISDNPEQLSDQERELISYLRKEAESKQYCGKTKFSILITLEQLAKQGKVHQIGFQWQEPNGWSFSDLEQIGILNTNEIRASKVITEVKKYVYAARKRSLAPLSIWFVTIWAAILAFGLGISWVRNGFKL